MKSRLIVFTLAMLVVASTLAVGLGTQTASADNGSHPTKQEKTPKLQPGWAKQGEVTYEVTSAPGQGQVSRTFAGPYGPITVIVSSDPVATVSSPTTQVAGAVTAATTEYSRSCKSEYWFGISARFTIYQSFRYNFSSVTWMGTTTYTDFSIPAYFWSGQTAWKDWSYGWQYAWGNGRANLRWGVGWLSSSVGNVANNVLVDAWGNCTARQTFKWF